MTSRTLQEVHSFVSKFAYLTDIGINANLVFNSFNGNVCASFNVNLGPIQQEFSRRSNCKPSKIRRRQRRQNARNNSEVDSDNVLVNDANQDPETTSTVAVDSLGENEFHVTSLQSNESEIESFNSSRQDPQSFIIDNLAVSSTSSCTVQPPHELSVMQGTYQSAACDDNVDEVLYKLYGPGNGLTAGNLCKFCDKEFSALQDFRSHFKKSGYICNNCLDFFSDMAWFSEAEADFKYIKYGALTASAASSFLST